MGINAANIMPMFLASSDPSQDFMIQKYMEVSFFGQPVYITTTHVCLLLLMAFILIVALIARRAILNGDPDKPTGLQNAVEMVIEFLDGLVEDTLGKFSKKYRNYILTLLIFVFLSNISGMFGLRPPTADFAVTLGLALISFVLIQYAAIKTSKFRAFTDLFKPIPLLFPINLIGEFATPISLSLRLFGNLMAGTIMMGLYYGLMPWFAKIGLPSALHAYLDLFSGLIQAYIFSVLTMVFLSQKLDG